MLKNIAAGLYRFFMCLKMNFFAFMVRFAKVFIRRNKYAIILDCLFDCQPKVRSDLMSFLNITSNELVQEMALLREVGLNIQEKK